MNGPKTGVPRRKRTTSAATTTCSSALVASAVLLFAVLLAYGPVQIPFGRNGNAPSHAVVSVGVLSACANFERRAAVRATWGKSDAFHGVDFFLGICKSKDLLERVIREQAVHGDIVMAPKSESYEHITHQTMHMMTVLSHDDRVTHVFKTDDDSFIKPQHLRELLDGLVKAHGPEQQMLVGHVEHVSAPIRDPNNKWYITEEQWAPPTYPVWAHGAGYVVTRRLAKTMAGGIPHLVNDGKILPKSEDVATGAWIEYQKTTLGEDVRYINDPRFTFTGRCQDSDIVTHYVEHPEQRCLFENGKCSICFPPSRL